jgi:hypothetical protein
MVIPFHITSQAYRCELVIVNVRPDGIINSASGPHFILEQLLMVRFELMVIVPLKLMVVGVPSVSDETKAGFNETL